MHCSYEKFFSTGYISKEQFFDFGLKETIYAPLDRAREEWASLKARIRDNDSVFIRGFGRKSHGTHFFLGLYECAFGLTNVKEDVTNNAEPSKLIKHMTGYCKIGGKNFLPLQNYQVTHIFGRTKNVYAFTAPWNIAYAPKILDPLTGHEAKGDIAEEYRSLFLKQCHIRFADLISDYNDIVTASDFLKKLDDAFSDLSQKITNVKDVQKYKKALEDEFRPIEYKAL
jgi:hypothetical protein